MLKLAVRRSCVLIAICGSPATMAGQTAVESPATSVQRYETRAELEAAARAADNQKHQSEAWLLRSRLQNGDFQEGDRIVITLETSAKPETLQVRAGKVLQFTGMADLSLDGVLRSELSDTLRHHLSRYLRNPAVRATPLLPLAVLGNVAAPGYYYTAADVVLRDVIMRAGGPRGDADLNRTIVRRAGEVIWGADDVRIALTDGLSPDRLHLKAGDEIYVPERRRFPLTTVLTIASSSIALIFTITQMMRR